MTNQMGRGGREEKESDLVEGEGKEGTKNRERKGISDLESVKQRDKRRERVKEK